MNFRRIPILLILLLFAGLTKAENPKSDKKGFDIGSTLMHHVMDSHDWHITDWPTGTDAKGEKTYKHIQLNLPWLFYSSRDGVQFSANTHALNAGGKYYADHHGHLHALKGGATQGGHDHGDHGHVDDHGHDDGHGHAHYTDAQLETLADKEVKIYDLSPTKTVVQMLLIGFVLILVFTAVARAYARNTGKAPKGMQSFFEPIITFVRDDIAKEYMGSKYLKFTPYLLTLFFFIWFSNIFGLMPFNSNIMGNISVTAALAILTFIIIQVNGSKDYWKHTLGIVPGVPVALIPLMFIIEVISLFVKPFALAIRLFANITAGHFMVLSLVCLIFLLGNAGANPTGAYAAMPLSIFFTLAILTLEVVVAIIQAYIFTLLTAVFVGMAMESHDDHH